jgi:hypothetical protein
MIIDPKTRNLKMSVFTKDGRTFLNRDIPSAPFGENERTVSFWNEDILLIFPLSEIEEVRLIPEKD